MTTTKARRKPVKPKGGGDALPLEIPLPGGGRARFLAPGELPPRKSREVMVHSTVVLPLMAQAASAKEVHVGGRLVDRADFLEGAPLGLSLEEVRQLADLSDVAAWAYLAELRDSTGQQVDLPADPEAVLDLPPRWYKAVTEHATKLLLSGDDGGFTVDSLPDDEAEQADPNLPT